jgi:hypothetical protein
MEPVGIHRGVLREALNLGSFQSAAAGELLAALYVLLVLLVFFGLGFFLKRHVLNKRPLPTAAHE